VPDASEAVELVKGRVCLVDGTITPCWSYQDHDELWSRKKGITGFNAQVVCLLDGSPVYISDPLDEDLNLPTPVLARRPGDSQRVPEIVVVEPSSDLVAYVAELGERAGKIRNRAVRPEEDNMLKVTGDGRKAALDLRLVGLPMTGPGKIA
jgi:hypothetical protein